LYFISFISAKQLKAILILNTPIESVETNDSTVLYHYKTLQNIMRNAIPNSYILLFFSRAERSQRSRDQQHLRESGGAREKRRGLMLERRADAKLQRLADLLRVFFVVFERSPRIAMDFF